MSVVVPGLTDYEVVLGNKYYLRELIEGITLEDSLEQIALRATVRLRKTDELARILSAAGHRIENWPARVSGIPFGGSGMGYLLHPGRVWDVEDTEAKADELTLTVYDASIAMGSSEDEYLFAAGTTASQRLKRYCTDWGIPVDASLPDTKVALAKAVKRGEGSTIYSMLEADLKETAVKGGDMYRVRWKLTRALNGATLTLFKIGSNATVWVLETGSTLEEVVWRSSMEGAITQVKVLGKAAEGKRSPILGIVKGETEKYGTLQKVFSDEKVKTASQATESGTKLLSGPTKQITVSAIDINTIRSGDKVRLITKRGTFDLIVCSSLHTFGTPGRMALELAEESEVRRRYFNER